MNLLTYFRPRSITLGDLYPLAAREVQEAEAHLRRIFEWAAERALSTIRITLGAAGALVAAYVTAVLSGDSDVSVIETAAIVSSAVVLGAIARYRHVRLNALAQREYAATVGLLVKLRRLRDLLDP